MYSVIPNFENYYVTKEGEIFNKTSGIQVKQYKKRDSLIVILKNKSKDFYISSHKLVAIAFIPNPSNKRFIRHIDGNKLNNNADNLEWVTASENKLYISKSRNIQLPEGNWRRFDEYPNYLFEYSGRVYSEYSNKIISIFKDSNNYNQVMLKSIKKERPSPVLLHQIIAKVFISNPYNYRYINHKDGDKTNNRVDNLEWCTARNNVKHAIETGLSKNSILALKTYQLSKRKQIKKIDPRTNKEMKIYTSISEAAKEMNTTTSNICKCLKNERNTTAGFKWEYV